MECVSSDIFSRHICSTVAETIGVTNYAASFGAKNVQETTFEAAEMMLCPWNQQYGLSAETYSSQQNFQQKDFINLAMWCDKWRIKLNLEKTKVIIFSRSQLARLTEPNLKLFALDGH